MNRVDWKIAIGVAFDVAVYVAITWLLVTL
jgi:hypothetical protein